MIPHFSFILGVLGAGGSSTPTLSSQPLLSAGILTFIPISVFGAHVGFLCHRREHGVLLPVSVCFRSMLSCPRSHSPSHFFHPVLFLLSVFLF